MLDKYRLATLHECISRTASPGSFPVVRPSNGSQKPWNEEELGLSETSHDEDTERLEGTIEEGTSVGRTQMYWTPKRQSQSKPVLISSAIQGMIWICWVFPSSLSIYLSPIFQLDLPMLAAPMYKPQ